MGSMASTTYSVESKSPPFRWSKYRLVKGPRFYDDHNGLYTQYITHFMATLTSNLQMSANKQE